MDPPGYYQPLLDGADLPGDASSRVALCLSGGGFRASLFHLGALRRLNELNILSKVTTISSVSGGSILSAFVARVLAQRGGQTWPKPGKEWDDQIAIPFSKFVARDARTRIVLRKGLPWNWARRGFGVECLENHYYKHLCGSLRLVDLPTAPAFVFVATDLTSSYPFIFSRSKIGNRWSFTSETPSSWLVAKAAAASSCFPPAFGPMSVQNPENPFTQVILVNDGGVRDNLAVDEVWSTHRTILISDGGRSFDGSGIASSFVRRSYQISDNQSASVRTRWFLERHSAGSLKGALWTIGPRRSWDITQDCKDRSREMYHPMFIAMVPGSIRTDLNHFTEAERQMLENHGYASCNYEIHGSASTLLPGVPEPFKIPHPNRFWNGNCATEHAFVDALKREFIGSDRRLSISSTLSAIKRI